MKLNHQLTFQLGTGQLETIQKQADAWGVSVGAYVRSMLPAHPDDMGFASFRRNHLTPIHATRRHQSPAGAGRTEIRTCVSETNPVALDGRLKK